MANKNIDTTGAAISHTGAKLFGLNSAGNAGYIPWADAIGPAGADGVNGAAGTDGATGSAGAAGANGTDGTDGSVWRSGSGVPSNSLGADGDYYLDTATGNVYKKASSAYSLDINLKGPAGESGSGSGDMILDSSQTVTGAKTFKDAKLLLRNAADTFSSWFTNTAAAARTWTLPDKSGTVAMTSDIPSVPTALADLSADATHRLTTDTEKSTWNGKQKAPTEGAFIDGDKTKLDNAQPSLGTVGTAGTYAIEENVLGVHGLKVPGTWKMFYSDGDGGGMQELSIGSIGAYLKSNGTGGPPSWDTPADQTTIISPEISVSTAKELTIVQLSRTILNNNGQTTSANIACTTVALQAGLTFNIFIGTALVSTNTWTLTVPSGVKILLNGVMGHSGGTLTFTAPAIGDHASCATMTSGSNIVLVVESNATSISGN